MHKIALGIATILGTATLAHAHGDTAPQAVETDGLPQLGEDWRAENPYRNAPPEVYAAALRVGSKGYNTNCARCHGLEAISGGLAPDLRNLEANDFGDEWFASRIQNGATQNGIYKMPPFKDIISQEAAWAIRLYLETRPKLDQLAEVKADALEVAQKLETEKDKAQFASHAKALRALSQKVSTVSGAPKADTPMDRAAALIDGSAPKPDRAVALLKEELGK